MLLFLKKFQHIPTEKHRGNVIVIFLLTKQQNSKYENVLKLIFYVFCSQDQVKTQKCILKQKM